MRLIDADSLMTRFCNLCEIKDKCEQAKKDGFFCNVRGIVCIEPTAYDIDKVVEQIKNNSFTHSSVNWMFVDDLVRTEEAIDIIRNGGKE